MRRERSSSPVHCADEHHCATENHQINGKKYFYLMSVSAAILLYFFLCSYLPVDSLLPRAAVARQASQANANTLLPLPCIWSSVKRSLKRANRKPGVFLHLRRFTLNFRRRPSGITLKVTRKLQFLSERRKPDLITFSFAAPSVFDMKFPVETIP